MLTNFDFYGEAELEEKKSVNFIAQVLQTMREFAKRWLEVCS